MAVRGHSWVRSRQRAAFVQDMTSDAVDLHEVLPPTQVVMVSVTGSTSNDTKLPQDKLDLVLEGCAEGLALHSDRERVRALVVIVMASVTCWLRAVRRS